MSFLFGTSTQAKTPNSPAAIDTKLTSPEYNTNRNIDDIVRGLINAINDEKQPVRDHIHASVRLIGLQEPILVLSKGLAFLNSTSRSNTNHRVLVMNVLSRVLDEQEEHNKGFSLPDDLAKALVIMSSVEIVADKSINSEWQNSACKLLISLARLVPDVVAKQMLDRFPSNEPPHYFVVKTLADFAHKYPILFLPHLKEVLTRALPILAVIKHDNLRWVFSAGLGRWAESIVVAMREKKTTVPKSEYSASIHTALKHVLGEWIASYELKVRLVAAEGIGYMAHIIETDHLTQLFPKLLPTFMQLMKKEARTDQLPVSIGLQNFIYVTVREAPEILNEHLQTLMQTVHSFIVMSLKAEGTYAKADKNEQELMKIFSVLGTKFTDQVVNYLLKQISENKDVHAKIATLRTLRHCIGTLITELSSYRSTIVAGVNLIANDEDYRVLHDLVLLANEMAPHDYLSNAGGTTLVNVVVRGASLTDNEIEQYEAKTGKKPGAFTPATVRTDADSALVKFTSNELSHLMDAVLWPFLLESLTPEKNHHSFAILCQCISDLSKRKRQDDDFIIDFDKMVNLPKPNLIFARLLVMLSEPFGRNNPGVNILRALYCLSPNIHAELVEVWSKKLAEMKRYLDGKDANSENFNQDQWENHLLNFLRESIIAVASDEWNVQLGDALISQVTFYKNRRKMKKASLSLLGLLVQLTKYKEFVNRAVGEIFNATDHASDEERLGCARGLGQASATHTDVVLTKLASVAKPAPKKSGFSLFSSAPVEVPGPKATALLSYGYVSMLTPQELFTARVDVHIIGNMIPVITESKAQEVKENGIRAIDFIAKAVSPKNIPNFVLKSRDELIKVILAIMNPPAQQPVEKGININKLRSLGLESISTLISLPPRITGPVQQSVLSGTLSIFSNEFTDSKVEETLLANINTMLSSLLLSDPCQGTLDDILQALETFVASAKLLERKRASNTFVYILKDFARLIAEKKTNEADGLRTSGRIIGKLVTRITEKVVDIRYTALDSLYLVLRIHQFLKTGTAELPEAVQRLGPLRGSLNTAEPNEIYAISKELAAILCDVVDSAQLSLLVTTLLATLSDFDEEGAGGSCVVLNGLVRVRGAELEKETPNLVKSIVESMVAQEKRTQIFNGLQHAVRGLARHFGLASMNALVSHKVPHSQQVIRSIQVLSSDKNLTSMFIDFLVDIMNNGQIFEERRGKGDVMETVPTHLSCSSTAAMHELLEMSEVGAIAKDNYAKILGTILLRIGASNAISSDAPTKDAQTCLKNFLVCAEDEDVLEKLEKNGIIDKCIGAQYADGIQDVLEAICKAHPEQIKPIFEFVKPFIIRTFIGQRVAATSMISVLLNNVKNDRETVHDALNSLLSRCGTDEKVIVKTYALRGLANLTKHPKDIMHKYATPVIAALNSCLEDADEGIILESMKSIKQIFAVADDEYVSLLLTTLCVRLKPAFEKSNPLLRESSILLYGTLARFAKGSVGDALINNVHSNLPTLIAHLQDDNKEVVKACKEALRKLVPELGSTLLADLFKQECFDADKPIDIDKFADDFAATWVKEFPERISDIVMLFVVFYKSAWDGCTTGAVLITGHMIAKISAEQRKRVNLKHTCLGLVSLLKSPSAIIREKAAKILGLLYEA